MKYVAVIWHNNQGTIQCFACEIGIQISRNVVCSCSVWRCPSVSQQNFEPLNLDWTLTVNIEHPTLSAQTLKVCQWLLHHSTLNTSPARGQPTLVSLSFSSCETTSCKGPKCCTLQGHFPPAWTRILPGFQWLTEKVRLEGVSWGSYSHTKILVLDRFNLLSSWNNNPWYAGSRVFVIPI